MRTDTGPARQTRSAERRSSLRHYLTRPLRAELVYGAACFALDSGCVGNISRCGLGLRSDARVGARPGTLATVAVAQDGSEVLTLSGEVVSIRNGIDLGIKLRQSDLQRLALWLGEGLDSTAVSTPENGLAHVSGELSVASLHPLRWAVEGGATRLNLRDVVKIDSAGIALLLMLKDKAGVTLEACPDHVCRLLRMVAGSSLCAGHCAKAALLPATYQS